MKDLDKNNKNYLNNENENNIKYEKIIKKI